MARLLDVGLRPYREVLALQREVHADVAAASREDTWIVCEHPAVVTLGRNAKAEHLLFSAQGLAALGVDYVEVERGGDVTFHGPGQLVVYPILKLPRFREIVPFVSALEEAVVKALAEFGIVASGRREHRGVYVGERAICAVGVAVKQMTSLHGLALNVSTELDYDRFIVPCGTPEFGVTSMSRELGRDVTVEEAKPVLLGALAARFGVEFEAAEMRRLAS
ncbi:MAG TPA: lipoyl(octanoyl) transferase LipB [Candidatus Baltobacteraceae bacterium]|nr:lipoyl(octanoyl) transferase LipB [Candidatus Baltobacteraceae bacterium]